MTEFAQRYINSFILYLKKDLKTIDDKIDRVLFQLNELVKEC